MQRIRELAGEAAADPRGRNLQARELRPAAVSAAGKPTTLSFTIRQPSGQPLTQYRRGPGPHTGVHVILVRSDLGDIIHRHPPVGPGGVITQSITFPTPGRYRLVIDAYTKTLRNLQLFRWIHVAGSVPSKPLPKFTPSEVVDGYRFSLQGRPRLHAIQAAFLTVRVTDPQGSPARFKPWYGALAHAIFFRAGSLDYFHTHVLGTGVSGCTSVLGATRIAGRSSEPGMLRAGVLVPVPGTWRLFLQCLVNGRVLTAPFTLNVG